MVFSSKSCSAWLHFEPRAIRNPSKNVPTETIVPRYRTVARAKEMRRTPTIADPAKREIQKRRDKPEPESSVIIRQREGISAKSEVQFRQSKDHKNH
jgi:hypothetical protein